MHPFYVIRGLGGILFLLGALVMVFNLWMTVKSEVVAGETETQLQPAE
jgi:cytochrome c oxidase cbb3-type subunit 1